MFRMKLDKSDSDIPKNILIDVGYSNLNPMNTRILILLCSIAIAGIPISTSAQSLKKTVKGFAKALTNLDRSQTDYVNDVRKFLDPEVNRDSLALDYYDHWKSNKESGSYAISSTVQDIRMTPKETSAIVFVANEWHMPDGSTANFLSESHWVKRDGKLV